MAQPKQEARPLAELSKVTHVATQVAPMSRLITHSGEGGIRTPDGLIAHTGFRDRRIQPLCHLSGGAGLKVVEAGAGVVVPAQRRGAKNARRRSAQSSVRSPLSTCGRWLS